MEETECSPYPHGATLRKFLSLLPHLLHTTSPKGPWGSGGQKGGQGLLAMASPLQGLWEQVRH